MGNRKQKKRTNKKYYKQESKKSFDRILKKILIFYSVTTLLVSLYIMTIERSSLGNSEKLLLLDSYVMLFFCNTMMSVLSVALVGWRKVKDTGAIIALIIILSISVIPSLGYFSDAHYLKTGHVSVISGKVERLIEVLDGRYTTYHIDIEGYEPIRVPYRLYEGLSKGDHIELRLLQKAEGDILEVVNLRVDGGDWRFTPTN